MTDNSKNSGGGGKGRPPRDTDSRRPSSRSDRPQGSGGDRPFRARPDGDRPARPQGDRPYRARPEGDRPRNDGDRPFRARPDGDRPRPQGDRPFRARPEGDRPRPQGDRPYASRGDRPQGDRPFRARPDGDRPRPDGDRPFRARPDGDRPRPQGDRPFRARSEGGDRPFRSRDDRPQGDRPNFRPRDDRGGDRPFRSRDDRPQGDRPFRARPDGDRPVRNREEGAASARPRFEDRGRGGPEQREKGPKIRKSFSDRIAKVIARAGLCSRRDAEAWIEAGRVAVNGTILTSPALDVTERDVVTVDGTQLPSKERTRLFLYHKPRGLVTTAWDPEGRPTVFGSLPAGLPRVVTIGRLDINTEGLLLLTNDGGLARVVSLPDTGWLRRYRVRAYGDITQADLDALRNGVTIDDMHYGPIEAEIERETGDNVWITLGIREGKNREVKRVLEHLGLVVNRLIRVSFGPFQLNDLPEGSVEEVRTAVLQDQLGPALAAQGECDFEAPVFVYEDEDYHPKKREWQGRPGEGERRPRGDGARFGERDRSRPVERFGPAPDADARPKRRAPTEPLRSIWRADEDEEGRAEKARVPRRGADPKAARTESAERDHERTGRIESTSGRKVLVERVKSEPREEIREEPRAPRRDEGERSFRPREDRPRQDRGDRPYTPRADRPQGDRPNFRPREGGGGDRPYTPRGDRPQGDRPSFRPREDRGGDRPYTPRGDRPQGDRPSFRPREGGGGDRPYTPRGDRPQGDRPNFRPREDRGGDRPYTPRGDRPQGDRPNFRPREDRGGDRPYTPRGDRPQADRPSFPPREDRGGDRPYTPRGDRPQGDRPQGDRAFKPRSDRPEGGGRSFGGGGGGGAGRSFGGKPSGGGGRPFGGKPSGGGGRPFGGKPSGGGGRPSGGAGRPRRGD